MRDEEEEEAKQSFKRRKRNDDAFSISPSSDTPPRASPSEEIMTIEQGTSSIEVDGSKTSSARKFDLEDRLIDFAVLVVKICDTVVNTKDSLQKKLTEYCTSK